MTIKFGKSASPHFAKAVELIIKLGGHYNREFCYLKIHESEIINKYNLLYPLVALTQNWKSFESTYNGAPANAMQVLYKAKCTSFEESVLVATSSEPNKINEVKIFGNMHLQRLKYFKYGMGVN